MSTAARRRMAILLERGNQGTLTNQEKQDLKVLVAEFEKKTLELAQALAQTVNSMPVCN